MVPYQKHSETSKKAALKANAKTQEIAAYAFIKRRGKSGATGDEVAEFLEIPIGTASARIVGLRDKGFIETTKYERLTRTGRLASIHIARL